MFTSKAELEKAMGVDPTIAAFFVDRKVPVNNQYWKGRYLYVARGTGYLFIPLFFDLKFKAGMKLRQLLDENYVQLMEAVLDKAAQYEFGELPYTEHINQIEAMVKDSVQNSALFDELHRYFKQPVLKKMGRIGTENPALNRGDALLYVLSTVDIEPEVLDEILDSWYLLVPTFLLLDDIIDFQEDRQKQEENSLAVYGYDAAGIRKAVALAESNFEALRPRNPLLSAFFEQILTQKKQTPYFKRILND